MSEYRYILDKGSKKHRCPGCSKKRFVRYIDRNKDEYLPEKYGRCDREVNCGYFLSPYDNDLSINDSGWKQEPQQEQRQPDFIPYEIFKASRKGYQKNKFIQYLLTLFDDTTVTELISKYHIGISKYWPGSTVFWQIDIYGYIRTGKVMLYDNEGHRVKEPFNHITWVHSLMYDDYELDQCLYGEHLLTDDKSVPVAIVESEKTAIIASVYFPKYTWLASGAKHNLKPEKCKSLIGRNVTLFPDLGAYKDWQQKAGELSYFCNINTSDLLENIAESNDKQAGYDLADYLIQFDARDFKARDKASQSKFKKGYPDEWDEVTLNEDDPEYIEATRHAINDADEDELKELCKRDPIVQKLVNLFDGEVTTGSEIILN